MKKIFVFLWCIVIPFCCFSQERVNSAPAKFIKKSPTMTNIKGWYYSDVTGNWTGQANVIPEGAKKVSDISFWLNCMSLQFRTMEHNNTTYYILCLYHKGYYYDYPEIEVGRHPCNAKQYWVLTQKDFEDFKLPSNSKFTKTLTVEDVSFCAENPSESDVIKYIKYAMSKAGDVNTASTYTGSFTIQRYNDVVRFYFTDACQSYTYSYKYEWDNSSLTPKGGYFKYDTSLEKQYFEIPYSSWLEMINAVK